MFQCKDGCKADCCGIVPISRKVYRKHKKKIPNFNIETVHYLKDDVLVITRNGFCGFLMEGKCKIYQDRPLVCKLYGTDPNLPCPYVNPDGIIRTDNEVKKVQDKIKTIVDTAMIELNIRVARDGK